MKTLFTLSAVIILSSSFAMASDLENTNTDQVKTQTAYQYDSSDDNGRNSDQ